jgi:nitric oxide reductase NorE protein
MVEAVESPPSTDGREHLPGGVDIWVFVLGDLMFFAAYFVIFVVYRIQEPTLFLDSQRHLSLTTGVVNTLVLLASSRFVAMAVQATRAGDDRRATRLISYGGLCGVLFVLIKVFEWHSEISRGFTLPHNDFFMFYYMLTGVHLFHVLLGLGFLTLIVREIRSPAATRVWLVEAGATFWHMVDLLWVFIFALVYLMR